MTVNGFQVCAVELAGWAVAIHDLGVSTEHILRFAFFKLVVCGRPEPILNSGVRLIRICVSKYPPAKPGALECWPLKAAGQVADATCEM
jgi:hypothetical protein